MWSRYDENLHNNPFYKDISENHVDIVQRCSEEHWIICVPRIGTFEPNQNQIEEILDHILVPHTTTTSYYTTLSKKNVTVSNKRINTTGNLSDENEGVEILFEETFYIEQTGKYTVWCVDSPLFSDCLICDAHSPTTLQTLHDCVDFLWVQSLGHGILEQIGKLVGNFHERLEGETLQSTKDLIGNVYSQCLQKALKNEHIKEKCLRNEEFCVKVKIAVETYMQNCFNHRIMFIVNSVTALQDEVFNKIVRNSSGLHLEDLGIPPELSPFITSAKHELNKLNHSVTILDKINVLRQTFATFNTNKENLVVTSDEILQLLVFLILKLDVNNWISNLVYMKEFRFSLLEYSDEASYFLASLEAAVEYVKSTDFPRRVSDCPSGVFQLVKSGDLDGIQTTRRATEYQGKSLCHPLCSCDDCQEATTSLVDEFINDKGQNLLIYATIQGQLELVRFFLKEPIEVNLGDYRRFAALHYAASKGHQRILLLLLDHHADPNIKTDDGNTPLHLASNNGHENCVKALLFNSRSLEVDSRNNSGETALHLATKRGFLEIMKLLLEFGARGDVRDRRNKTPGELAGNYYARKLFGFCGEAPAVSVENIVSSKEAKLNDDCLGCHGVRPRNVDEFKKIDLLLKAIENNDTPLTCFHLGFDSLRTSSQTTLGKCHPLCDCLKCRESDDALGDELIPRNHPNINTCNLFGFTPLHTAAKFGRMEILRLLLDFGALMNVRTYKTLLTPLHLACIFQRIQIVKELLQCGDCQVDPQDSKGYTPLYYACIKNDFKLVEVLLGNGADCSKRNFGGRSVLNEVEGRVSYRIFKILKSSYGLGKCVEQGDVEDDWLS